MRYEVLFGYKSGYEEWLKFESDNYDDSLAFFNRVSGKSHPFREWDESEQSQIILLFL